MARPWQILHSRPRPVPATDAPYHAVVEVQHGDDVGVLLRRSAIWLEPTENLEAWTRLRVNAQRLAVMMAVDLALPAIQEFVARPANAVRTWTRVLSEYPDASRQRKWKANLRSSITRDVDYYLSGAGYSRNWREFPTETRRTLAIGLKRAMENDTDISAVCYLIAGASRIVDPAPPILDGEPALFWFPDVNALRIEALSWPDVPVEKVVALQEERGRQADEWLGIWWRTVKDVLAVKGRPRFL